MYLKKKISLKKRKQLEIFYVCEVSVYE